MQHQPGGRLLVLREITQLKEVQRELERLATTDTLTGAYNRRHFFKLAESAESEVERCRRHQLQLALILMDVDHFKRVNDRYGHPAGDRVLVAVAEACARDTRGFDVFARYGGEEFALLLPGTLLGEALEVAERLRARLAEMRVEEGGAWIGITASLGVGLIGGGSDTLEDLLRRADQALYAAKAGGRNRVDAGAAALPPAP